MVPMSIVEQISISWGWTGLQPIEVVEQNDFGNLIVKDVDGAFWRICPEELTCKIIAGNFEAFKELWKEREFAVDWKMKNLTEVAKQSLGSLQSGMCYCLKLPAAIGGEYESKNIGSVKLMELISFSGDLAFQVKDVPDGGKIRLEIVD